MPPVAKSGKIVNRFPCRCLTEASISSIKLCGSTFVESPTAIPSAPCANNKGNITGRLIGSFRRPSYEACHCVIFGLKTTSKANLDNRASIYLEAAALSPVSTLPQLPWASINKSF